MTELERLHEFIRELASGSWEIRHAYEELGFSYDKGPDLLPPPGRDLPGGLTIVIEGEPQGKGRPRFTVRGDGKNRFVQVFTDDRTAAYEELIQLEVLRVMGGMELMREVTSIRRRTMAEAYAAFGYTPHFMGPVRIEMEMRHPVRVSWTKAKTAGALSGHIAPTLKVDFDNCAKVFCDAFNGILWGDDTQVIRASIERTFAEEPSVLVRVIPLDLESA